MEQLQDKIAKIELATVRAVTELQAEVKNLTDVVRDLKTELQRRDETFVTITAHARDIQDIYSHISTCKQDTATLKEEAEEAHASLSKAGKSKAILWSIFTAVIMLLVSYVANDLMRVR